MNTDDDPDDFDFLYADDWDLELDDSLEHVDDEPDNCDANLSDDEREVNEPIQLSYVRRAKAQLEGADVLEKVKKILKLMADEHLPLPLFLDALSWGESECISDKTCSYARTALMVSDELPRILERWYKPRGLVGLDPQGGGSLWMISHSRLFAAPLIVE
ncbi:hypothetical protein B0H13DRAFT_1586990 [Mycena leptocephala]|nr:hypothetical protein B0H13DRAFT_1586990 [Mycena leptocephala]